MLAWEPGRRHTQPRSNQGKMMNFAARNAFCRGFAALAAGTIAGGAALPALAQDTAILEEITVTARKKEEIIQEVPVAVTAISASMIESMNLQNLDAIFFVFLFFFSFWSVAKKTCWVRFLDWFLFSR